MAVFISGVPAESSNFGVCTLEVSTPTPIISAGPPMSNSHQGMAAIDLASVLNICASVGIRLYADCSLVRPRGGLKQKATNCGNRGVKRVQAGGNVGGNYLIGWNPAL